MVIELEFLRLFGIILAGVLISIAWWSRPDDSSKY